jgi:hypothetical protein
MPEEIVTEREPKLQEVPSEVLPLMKSRFQSVQRPRLPLSVVLAMLFLLFVLIAALFSNGIPGKDDDSLGLSKTIMILSSVLAAMFGLAVFIGVIRHSCDVLGICNRMFSGFK